MKFSVIIPFYNPDPAKLLRAIESCQGAHEVIIINDGTDKAIPEAYWGPKFFDFPCRLINLQENQGPGIARNVGMAAATGDWLVFLDADDELAPTALTELMATVNNNPSADLIRFGRSDLASEARWFTRSQAELLRAYAGLRMDGSVCGTAVRRETVGKVQFRTGLHEDVDWLYLAYSLSAGVLYLDRKLYLKGPPGVTSTVTERHLDGFVEAMRIVLGEYYHRNDECGIIAAVATRAREIHRKGGNRQVALYNYLWATIPDTWKKTCLETTLETQYAQIAKAFVTNGSVPQSMYNKSWSCKDLHNSAYLGPDEVRACCKRFFVNGQRRGDVVLLKHTEKMMHGIGYKSGPIFSTESIQTAKQELLTAINAGEETSCSGCPWLTFQEHGPVPEQVTYLSMEHHSVCNLQCSYCDTKYWDGRRPTYDAARLAKELVIDSGKPRTPKTVVWGGGEPTVSPEFKELVYEFGRQGIHQRILSNSVKYSHEVDKALRAFPNTELVTSIDAGTPSTFKQLRGQEKLHSVLDNLQKYTLGGPSAEKIVIKYILTEANCSAAELESFVVLCEKYLLMKCSFQISCDFRQESASQLELDAVLTLYSALLKVGVGCVFIDDLARLRITGIKINWHTLKYPQGLAWPQNYPAVMVWGRGEMASLLLRKSLFFKKAYCALQIDSSSYTNSLASLQLEAENKDFPIVIAASQSYPRIFRELRRCGLEHRVVKELIL